MHAYAEYLPKINMANEGMYERLPCKKIDYLISGQGTSSCKGEKNGSILDSFFLNHWFPWLSIGIQCSNSIHVLENFVIYGEGNAE